MHRTGPDPVTFGSLHHLEGSAPPENLGHQAAVARIEMLHDDDRRRKAGGRPFWEVIDGRVATGRRGEGDHIELRAWKVRGGCRRSGSLRLRRGCHLWDH